MSSIALATSLLALGIVTVQTRLPVSLPSVMPAVTLADVVVAVLVQRLGVDQLLPGILQQLPVSFGLARDDLATGPLQRAGTQHHTGAEGEEDRHDGDDVIAKVDHVNSSRIQ